MFTGIIECIGTIIGVQHRGTSIILTIKPENDDFPVNIGGSVAVDGTCLTLERREGGTMQFNAVAETLHRTTLSEVSAGRRVNLERAALLGSRLDGHFVYGHVDGTGTILRDREMNGSIVRTIAVPAELSRFMAEKGAIAVDGISLTIAESAAAGIAVSLIPHTLKITTMPLKKAGDTVNLECDMVARYLYRFMQTGNLPAAATAEPLLSLMQRSGF
ncbi:MAG: riboflavin synthase [Chitinispirillaceae bacterium]|nr:riboflavin synthase [Chitinispirillaceae bacterium]